MNKAIGIDLGTTNSVVAFKDVAVKILRNKENEELTRSCVAIFNDKEYVGQAAYNCLLKDPLNTILSIKRLMGTSIKDEMVQEMIKKKYFKCTVTELKGGTQDSVAVVLRGKQYSPEEISAKILRKLKEDAEQRLGDKVTHAVISVPAYFTEKQKNATKLAAQLAGLKVQKILAEPTAAAIAYGVNNIKPGEAKTVMIYDFGGGTFDLSILNIVDGQFLEAGTSGNRWLGGDDIDMKMIDMIYNKVQKDYEINNFKQIIENLPSVKRNRFEGEIRQKTEAAKIQLSSSNKANVSVIGLLEDENGDIIDIDVDITRGEFEKLVKPLVQETLDLTNQLLHELSYDIEMIDSILLVGGSSCMPIVKEMLSQKYGEDKVQSVEKPMLIVAEGAAILANRLDDINEITENKQAIDEISYSTTHNYFIELEREDGSTYLEKIIDKQEALPVNKVDDHFKTTVKNQKIVKIKIFSDVEDGKFEEMIHGFFTIEPDLPARSELVFSIELNINEIFEITAYPKLHHDHKQQIVLGRGKKDSYALNFIAERFEKINSDQYTSSQQEYFYSNMQRVISKINSLGTETPPDSNTWSELGNEVYNIFEEAGEQSAELDEDQFTIMKGTILCSEYSMFIEDEDLSEMSTCLKNIGKRNDLLARQAQIRRLKEIVEEYNLLLSLFMLKIAAENAKESNPADATKLLHMHDEILSLIQTGNPEEAFSILAEAGKLNRIYFSGFSSGIGITR